MNWAVWGGGADTDTVQPIIVILSITKIWPSWPDLPHDSYACGVLSS